MTHHRVSYEVNRAPWGVLSQVFVKSSGALNYTASPFGIK